MVGIDQVALVFSAALTRIPTGLTTIVFIGSGPQGLAIISTVIGNRLPDFSNSREIKMSDRPLISGQSTRAFRSIFGIDYPYDPNSRESVAAARAAEHAATLQITQRLNRIAGRPLSQTELLIAYQEAQS